MSCTAGVTRSQQRGTHCPLSFFQTYMESGMAEAAWVIGREGRAGLVLPRMKLPAVLFV